MKLKRIGALAVTLALALSLAVVPTRAASFTDVPESFWGYEYIKRMSDKGYAKGYEDGSFKPNGKMTAVETLLFCARATGVETNTQNKIAADRSKDMAEVLPLSNNMNVWAANEMALAVETGVLTMDELESLASLDPKSVTSTSAGKTYLEETMSRENICKYLVRAMQLEPLAKSLSAYSLSYKYIDAADIDAELQPYVYVLTNYGVVQGKETGNFDPHGAVTRAEMTTMLCRALDAMEEMGIVTELSEYTTYDWTSGTISAVTEAADGSVILTLYSDAAETTQSYSVPASAEIYKDNMLTDSGALKRDQFARLNLSSRGAVEQVRLGGALTTYTGSVSHLSEDQISLVTGSQARTFDIDRFTQVVIGRSVGDRALIDEEAGYTTAVCFVDGMGHLAAVRLSGGAQVMEGLVESVTVSGSGTTLGVTGFNGVVYRYAIPTGTAVTVNGVLGSLSASQVGRHVKLRVDTDDAAKVSSVAVDTVSSYVQGPIRRLGTVGSARSVYIGDIFSGKEVTYTVSDSAAITYDGEVKTKAQIESGWYVTALISGNMISQMSAYPGSTTVEGVLSAINYGTSTLIRITRDDGTAVNYTLDITDLPTIDRDNRSSSIDQLRTGDRVVITIRYNEVERIDATPQTADLTGVIDRVTQERTGVHIELTLSDGESAEYSVSEGVTVTQNGVASNIYALKPGSAVALVTDGDEVISIDITAVAASSTELGGVVLVTSTTGKTITVQVTDAAGKTSLVVVNVKNATLVEQATGDEVSLRDFSAGDTVRAFGAYEDGTFAATIVILQ